MADGNEDVRADDLPGPAYEGYESLELACPAERSGHVAVGDGRHMFVWGGYKVSARRAAAPRVRGGGRAGRPPGALPRRVSARRCISSRAGSSSPVPRPVPTRLGCCPARAPPPARPPLPARGALGSGEVGALRGGRGARPRGALYFQRLGV